MKQKKMKKEQGITIIALVITIIVMLILAGVTINLTMTDGIFQQALQAKEKSKIGDYLDKIELSRAGVSVDNMGEVTLDKLINKIYEEKVVPDNSIVKINDERAKMTTEEGYVFVITVDKVEYVGMGDKYQTPPELQKGDIEFIVSEKEWTNKNIKVGIKNNVEGEYTLKYSYNAKDWEKYEKELEIEENKIIYACVENVLGEKSSIASCAITKIDKLAPIQFVPKITTSTNSISIDASQAKDAEETTTNGKSGIKEISYSKDDGTTWETNENTTNYIFAKLGQGEKYKIKVRVIDNAGNQTITETQEITTETITGLNITVSDANIWTNTKTITISANNNNYSTIRYTIDGTIPTTSSTEYTKAFTVSSNCTITAIAFDNTNQDGIAATNTITKIDNTAPNISVNLATSDIKENAFTAGLTTISAESGLSKIEWYYKSSVATTYTMVTDTYATMNGSTSGITTAIAKTHTFSGLTPGIYNVYVIVYDVAGNKTTSSTITVTLIQISVTNYSGTYDGRAHTATITSNVTGTTFTYGKTAGSYTLSSIPTYTNAGTYTIYWRATTPSGVNETGTATVKIAKATGTISLSIYNNMYIAATTNSGGTISAVSSNTNIIKDCTITSNKYVQVNPFWSGSSGGHNEVYAAAGSATITVTVAATTNYTAASATKSVTIGPNLISSSIGTEYNCNYLNSSGSIVSDAPGNQWAVSKAMTLSAGYYWFGGFTGGNPRAGLWSGGSLVRTFSVNGGSHQYVSGNWTYKTSVFVQSGTYNRDVSAYLKYYCVRKITFN